jgi:hypothetical protein
MVLPLQAALALARCLRSLPKMQPAREPTASNDDMGSVMQPGSADLWVAAADDEAQSQSCTGAGVSHVVCPKCGGLISPAQIRRVDFASSAQCAASGSRPVDPSFLSAEPSTSVLS